MKKIMRILIDTNILISGLFFGGLPKKLLAKLDEKFNICANEKILSEYNEQIDKKIFNPKYKINEEILSEYNEQIDKKIFNPKYKINEEICKKFFKSLQSFEIKSNLKICRDPDDDKFINCAIDAKAIYVVSGDNDLLTIKNFAGIEMLQPENFTTNI